MPRVWRRDPNGGASAVWEAVALDAAVADLRTLVRTGERAHPGAAAIQRSELEGRMYWVLFATPEVRVNGFRVPLGLHALRDRDQIRIGRAAPVYFSTEDPPTLDAAPAVGSIFCPRCTTEIAGGAGAVRCPKCGIWHHMEPNRECWTYAATCTLCDQPTALDGDYRWTPDRI